MAGHPDPHAQDEAKRILAGIEAQEGNILGRAAGRLENHLGAADADQSDAAEVWGTRIGRTIALAATLFVIAWALTWLFSN